MSRATPVSQDTSIPSEAEFLAADVASVAAVAPKSIVYAPGGTRRSATFAGVTPWSAEYVRMSHDHMVACLDVIFGYGVDHVFTPAIMTTHANEVDDVAQQLIIPVAHFMTDPYLLQLCYARGWRIRIAPSDYQGLLQPYIELLEKDAPQDAKHTWWLTCTPSQESWWTTLLAAAKSEQVATRDDAIRALYGEEIPLISLCIAFGKPMISPDLFPPLLMDTVQCYWSQQVGYSLSDAQFRRILYDAAFLRQTWQRDKTARAREAHSHQEIWQQDVIFGLGTRLGPFWYPRFSGDGT